MKRIATIISAVLLFAVSFSASATIAYPHPIKITQPDGSEITIQVHGDEFRHWLTSDGKVVELDADGFYRPATAHVSLKASSASGMSRENAVLQSVSSKITTGENHFLVVLVEFKDLAFKVADPQQAFSNLLNQEGYSQNGGTGSVRDFYYQNSRGGFKPVFDVVGPVKVSQNSSYYGNGSNGNDDHATLAFWQACKLLDSQVDFSKYDLDGDGIIDNIFFYYAGHNEAESGSASEIWPHKWDFRSASERNIKTLAFDGKTLGTYACTSELKGASGTTMCGIGTFCHEFGHVLGLPDLYDTDYEKNGEAFGMGPFSLMSSGNYNNDGCTPPALSAVERQILGWMGEIEEWTQPGVKTVPDIMQNQAFMTRTLTDGEYFVYETRGGSVWDRYIGADGLLIYHVDRSSNMVSSQTAASLWSNGGINAYGDHPCCQPMPAGGSFSTSQITYPGSKGITSFDENSPSPMVDWNGNQTGKTVSDIRYAGGEVTLSFGHATGKTVSGTVKDKNGNPVTGASVVLAPVTSSRTRSSVSGMQMKALQLGQDASSSGYAATVSSDGTFSFDLSGDSSVDFALTVTCHGYIDYASSFRLTVGEIRRNIVLKNIEVLSEETEYQRFDWTIDYGTSLGQPVVSAIRYPAEELSTVAGSQMSKITYAINDGIRINEARIIVDFGDVTALNLPLANPVLGKYAEVDVSSYNILIPSGKDVYVGIYVDAAGTDAYPILYNSEMKDNNGFYVRLLQNHEWIDFSDEGSIAMAFTLKPTVTQPYAYGFNGISNPKDGHYAAGESFRLELVKSAMVPDSVDWFFDGKSVTGQAVTVPAGEHVVKAVLHFNSGKTETIEQLIIAE